MKGICLVFLSWLVACMAYAHSSPDYKSLKKQSSELIGAIAYLIDVVVPSEFCQQEKKHLEKVTTKTYKKEQYREAPTKHRAMLMWMDDIHDAMFSLTTCLEEI